MIKVNVIELEDGENFHDVLNSPEFLEYERKRKEQLRQERLARGEIEQEPKIFYFNQPNNYPYNTHNTSNIGNIQESKKEDENMIIKHPDGTTERVDTTKFREEKQKEVDRVADSILEKNMEKAYNKYISNLKTQIQQYIGEVPMYNTQQPFNGNGIGNGNGFIGQQMNGHLPNAINNFIQQPPQPPIGSPFMNQQQNTHLSGLGYQGNPDYINNNNFTNTNFNNNVNQNNLNTPINIPTNSHLNTSNQYFNNVNNINSPINNNTFQPNTQPPFMRQQQPQQQSNYPPNHPPNTTAQELEKRMNRILERRKKEGKDEKLTQKDLEKYYMMVSYLNRKLEIVNEFYRESLNNYVEPNNIKINEFNVRSRNGEEIYQEELTHINNLAAVNAEVHNAIQNIYVREFNNIKIYINTLSVEHGFNPIYFDVGYGYHINDYEEFIPEDEGTKGLYLMSFKEYLNNELNKTYTFIVQNRARTIMPSFNFDRSYLEDPSFKDEFEASLNTAYNPSTIVFRQNMNKPVENIPSDVKLNKEISNVKLAIENIESSINNVKKTIESKQEQLQDYILEKSIGLEVTVNNSIRDITESVVSSVKENITKHIESIIQEQVGELKNEIKEAISSIKMYKMPTQNTVIDSVLVGKDIWDTEYTYTENWKGIDNTTYNQNTLNNFKDPVKYTLKLNGKETMDIPKDDIPNAYKPPVVIEKEVIIEKDVEKKDAEVFGGDSVRLGNRIMRRDVIYADFVNMYRVLYAHKNLINNFLEFDDRAKMDDALFDLTKHRVDAAKILFNSCLNNIIKISTRYASEEYILKFINLRSNTQFMVRKFDKYHRKPNMLEPFRKIAEAIKYLTDNPNLSDKNVSDKIHELLDHINLKKYLSELESKIENNPVFGPSIVEELPFKPIENKVETPTTLNQNSLASKLPSYKPVLK